MSVAPSGGLVLKNGPLFHTIDRLNKILSKNKMTIIIVEEQDANMTTALSFYVSASLNMH